MADLSGQTIASSYEQLLSLPDGGGNANTLVAVTDGDGGTTFGIKLATNKVEIIPGSNDANAFEVSQADGTAVFTVNTSTAGASVAGTLTTSDNVSIVKSNDGGDVSLTIKNSAGAGSTDETSSIQFTTTSSGHATAAVIGARQNNYNDSASRDGELKLQASENGSLGSKLILRGSEAEFFTNVGIGAAPANSGGMNRQLEVTATSDAQVALRATADLSGTARIGDFVWYTNHGSTPQVAAIQGSIINGAENEGIITFHTRNAEAGGAPPERVRIDNSGEVIFKGGTSYSAEFQGDVKILDNNSDARLLIGDTVGGGDYCEISWDSSDDKMKLGVAGDEGTMVLDTNGNVSIGTASADAKFHVSGQSKFQTDSEPVIIIAGSEGATDHTNENSALCIDFRNLSTTNGVASGIVGLDKDGLELTKVLLVTDNHDANDGSIRFHTSTDSGSNHLLERMRVTHDGNVGIGTTNPIGRFQVEDAAHRSVRYFSKTTSSIGANSGNPLTTTIGTFTTKYDGTGDGHACMIDAVVTARVAQSGNDTSIRTVGLRILIARAGNNGGGANTNTQVSIIETTSSLKSETGSSGTMQSISFTTSFLNGIHTSSSDHGVQIDAVTTIDDGSVCAIDFIGMMYGNSTIEFG